MKHFISLFAILMIASASMAETKWTRVEASTMTLVGKAFNTPNPYHRVDTMIYKGFTPGENFQCRVPAGLAVLFKTNAKTIGASVDITEIKNDSYRSYRGFDLYIKKDGKWLWAGMNDFPQNHHDANKVITIVSDMDGTEKECMLYLPIYSELKSCKICIPEGASIEPMPSPFRHKIVFHGSSFTHGVSTTRAGMSYPVQFMRRTGMQPITLGFSGNCKMQPYFATVLENVEADAYVFDPFSNPNSQLIKERLMTFIDRMVKAHPGKPLIFQQTIYWERENFNMAKHNEFVERRALVEEMMKAACKKYKDVYFIHPDAALHNGESSTADGVHPNDNGYSVWEKSIEKPILKILKKYGIK